MGLRVLGFRVLGLRVLGFKVLGLGFRVRSPAAAWNEDETPNAHVWAVALVCATFQAVLAQFGAFRV